MLNVYIYKIEPVKDVRGLPSNVLKHVNRYTHKEAKAQSLFAWTKACDLLSDYDFDFKRLSFKNDEPVIKNSKIWFSLSHSDKYVAIAIADCPVGIDIQKNVDKKQAQFLAQRILNNKQQMFFTTSKFKSVVFTCLFTQIEALYKMEHFMTKHPKEKHYLQSRFNLKINKELYSLSVVNKDNQIITFSEIETDCKIKLNKK